MKMKRRVIDDNNKIRVKVGGGKMMTMTDDANGPLHRRTLQQHTTVPTTLQQPTD